MKTVEEFAAERAAQNETVMKYAGLSIKRFYGLDAGVYREGVLPRKTKELIGLVASLVLRCDDCVKYHAIGCKETGVTDAELDEALSIGLVIGGSIAIPHLRRAIAAWDELKA